MFEPKTKTIEVSGQSITIKKLSLGDRTKWLEAGALMSHLIHYSMVGAPAIEAIEQWDADASDEIITAVLEFNNLKKKVSATPPDALPSI